MYIFVTRFVPNPDIRRKTDTDSDPDQGPFSTERKRPNKRNRMKKLFLTIGFAAGTLMLAAQPQVVAHRGFHAAEGSWENTVSSLRNAQKLGVYGVEFDVNMTADDSLIVYHGPKILDTKLHAQKNRFAEIRAVKLPGGLEIPTLREFFAQGQKDPSTKLILEIKKHATPQRETQVVEAILRLAREMRLVPQIEFISFSRHACDEVLRLQPDAVVVYVSSDMAAMSPAEAKKRGYGGLSYQLNVLMNRPELVDEANRLGIATTLWMVNDCELIDWAARHGITYVSTDCPDKAEAYLEAVAAYKNKNKK